MSSRMQVGRPVERIAYQIPDACAASGVGRSSLYNAIKANELATLKVGKRRLIEHDELKRWLATKRTRVV
jgi:excisionase family DNA binding protein